MSWGNPNPYYDPEKFDLAIVHEIDDPNASYEYETMVLWRHADGRLFYATDSGCSCPTPFEDFKTLNDLTELTDATFPQFVDAIDGFCTWTSNEEGAKAVRMLRHGMLRAGALALRGIEL